VLGRSNAGNRHNVRLLKKHHQWHVDLIGGKTKDQFQMNSRLVLPMLAIIKKFPNLPHCCRWPALRFWELPEIRRVVQTVLGAGMSGARCWCHGHVLPGL
jgi:hypothetical protein